MPVFSIEDKSLAFVMELDRKAKPNISVAIDEIFKLDEVQEAGDYHFVEMIIKDMTKHVDLFRASIPMSILTVTHPWKEHYGENRDALYHAAHAALAAKKGTEYADESFDGLL